MIFSLKYLFVLASIYPIINVASHNAESGDHGHDHDDDEELGELTLKNINKAMENIQIGEFQKFTPEDAVLWEQFTPESYKEWIPSEATDINPETGEKYKIYTGEWALEKPYMMKSLENDYGLTVKSKSRLHAISKKFDKVFNPKGKSFIIQYEVKYQETIECAGSYLKIIRDMNPPNKDNDTSIMENTFNPKEFSYKTPFTVMFGPDICGEGKVHFILNVLNPITNEYEEKKLVDPPMPRRDIFTHLYTLIIDTDNTFRILIDNSVAREGNLFTEFDPPINPPKEIPDVTAKKPEDWVDEKEIVDEAAMKPDDWDEDAPKVIEDLFSAKPKDWLENESYKIVDKSAKKPESWDDEMDGEWEPPMIDNKKCIGVSGCGPYIRPMILNPNYKGKWTPPMIRNPKYKGEWQPPLVNNTNYYEIDNPCDLTKMLWTVNSDIMFDNIYIGTAEEESSKYAFDIWGVKYEKEIEIEETVKFVKTDKIGKEEFNRAPSMFDVRGQILYHFYRFNGNVQTIYSTLKKDGIVEAYKVSPYTLLILIAIGLYASFLLFEIKRKVINPIFSSAPKPKPKSE
ncbi:Calnexin-like protein [Smittium culicis]|uniref:Calnexin-like protein n=3 Tax=Smittium culicis TaxID=133412 RepID=A0A1R1XH55_9FUNG|nr:Calnexin-like protein [Smittium culicis]